VQQREHQEEQGDRSEDSPLRLAAPTDVLTAEPRDALHEADETEHGAQIGHGLKFSLAALGILLLVAGAEGKELTVAWAALLGAVQGATEFLPVSSSGHLSLSQAWLGIDPETAGHRFNIVLHAGTLVAVAWVYRTEVLALLRVLARPHVDGEDRTRLAMMFLASLPLGVVLVPAVEDVVVRMETSTLAVGVALWTTAAILFFGFRGGRGNGDPTTRPPTPKQAILIGLSQLLAVLPGISRSGTTIAVGIAVGLDRASAARFSFLISLIAIGGASAKEVLEVATADASAPPLDPLAYGVGFVTSLVVGLLSLRGLLYLVGKGKVMGFVIYLAIIGAIAVATGVQ
jgi:undecaprenyl-diphosphatase